jgi:hypothetical protein
MQEGVCAVNAPRVLVDIDTPEAYKTMYKLHHKYKG